MPGGRGILPSTVGRARGHYGLTALWRVCTIFENLRQRNRQGLRERARSSCSSPMRTCVLSALRNVNSRENSTSTMRELPRLRKGTGLRERQAKDKTVNETSQCTKGIHRSMLLSQYESITKTQGAIPINARPSQGRH
jgi:hypothetical protein